MKADPYARGPLTSRVRKSRPGPETGRRLAALTAGMWLLLATACSEPGPQACNRHYFEGLPYLVCGFDPAEDDIRLFLADETGTAFRQFERVADHVGRQGGRLVFAMNAGMYHPDRRPVGLFIEEGETRMGLVKSAGPGNFGMLPNGVLWIDTAAAGVTETHAYASLFAGASPRFATQSGPMLVIDGNLHPALNPTGTSLRRRNGAGISPDGKRVYFVISEVPVNFHSFARFFRDELQTPDALYLDGGISRIYVPALERNETGNDLGPIIGVIGPG